MAFKLHEATERFRLAIDGTGEGIWDWNVKSGEVKHDRYWRRFLGFEDAEDTLADLTRFREGVLEKGLGVAVCRRKISLLCLRPGKGRYRLGQS